MGRLVGSARKRPLTGVARGAAPLRNAPMRGEAAMPPPTPPPPADQPPRLRQSRFCVWAARLGTRGALAVPALGPLAEHLPPLLQGNKAVSTMRAGVQSPPTNATKVVFTFLNHPRESGGFGAGG